MVSLHSREVSSHSRDDDGEAPPAERNPMARLLQGNGGFLAILGLGTGS